MQKPFVFTLLLTLTFGCGTPAPPPPAPAAIVLDFQPLSAAEMATFHDDFGIHDTLRQYIKPSDFMLLTIQNNAYDTLWIYQLQKFGPTGRVYQSSGWDEYDIVGDSIYTEWSGFKCYFGSGSDVRLLKGQNIKTYFEGKCSDGVKIFAYSFSFMADSLGTRKEVHIKQFPCKHHYKMDNVSAKTIH
jgi:hypothetical protein